MPAPSVPPAARRALQRALGSCVRTDPAALAAASLDGMKLAFLPDAVVRVRAAAEVGAVLRLANRHGVPVTVRGAGSSLTGSAAPRHGGWVLDVSGLRALRIDPEAGTATVGPGVVTARLQEAAEKAGWMYGPDPASSRFCTLGGNIACNAGGLRGAKYGVTRDHVLALEGFLPTGAFVRWGRAVRKFATGYNLRDLWIGSEGTLGVVTRATVRLVPAPAARRTLAAAFEDEGAALRAVRELLRARVVPSVLEFLDTLSVGCAEKATGVALFPAAPGRPLLLVEVDGAPGAVEHEAHVVEAWAGRHALAWEAAADAAARDRLWSVRRQCSRAMFQLADGKLNEDVVVPVAAEERLLRAVRRVSRRHGVPMPTFGHAADGNFHVNIMFHRDDREEARRARAALGELMGNVVRLGGAISGEHGIGLAKSPFLSLVLSPAERAAMLAVKRALDPRGILNPGKIFEPYEVWDKRPEKVKLPWDGQ